MKKIIMSLLFSMFFLWGLSLYAEVKGCPENPVDDCPEGFLCKTPKPYKGERLKKKLAVLNSEYKKKWVVHSVEVSLGSKLYAATKQGGQYAAKKIISGVESLNKKIKESTIGKKLTKTKVADLMTRLKRRVGKFQLIKPMDKEEKSNIFNLEKKTVNLRYVNPSNVGVDNTNEAFGMTKFYIYSSRKWKNEKRPLLIIMPPVYGISPFDIGMAARYVKHGFKVAILELGGFKFVSPFQHTRNLPRTMVKSMGDVHRLIEHMVSSESVDRSKIGIFGFSLGGIFASLAFTVNKDIKALSLAVGGGNFAEILTNSKQAVASLYRKYRMKEEKIATKEEYFKVMQKAFSYDPVRFAHLKDPKDVYLVFTEGDSAVPTKNQRDLERAFGASCKKGNSRWEVGEHFVAIIKDLLHRESINKFFKDRLQIK